MPYLLKQSGESLAGRVEYVEMQTLTLREAPPGNVLDTRLWVRGGFPDSYLAALDDDSIALRNSFVRTYLERDVPMFGGRIAAETLGRQWSRTCLAGCPQ